jgi:hypothetical protein
MLQQFVDPAAIAAQINACRRYTAAALASTVRPAGPGQLTPDLLRRMSASVPSFVRSRHDGAELT